jgi:hypothetical protein
MKWNSDYWGIRKGETSDIKEEYPYIKEVTISKKRKKGITAGEVYAELRQYGKNIGKTNYVYFPEYDIYMKYTFHYLIYGSEMVEVFAKNEEHFKKFKNEFLKPMVKQIHKKLS